MTVDHCAACDAPQLARNHFFTGKLLLERDFTDEQLYVLGKQRRHNQQLHGVGIACGLEVGEHPNPACRDQFVILEPGTAVDCCGHEILVTDQEVVPLRQLVADAWAAAHDGEAYGGSHDVQLCLRYRECFAEQVPALFDDSGCDGDVCQPGRILDSHELGIVFDPPASDSSSRPTLRWSGTHNIAYAYRIAVDTTHKRLYVLTTGTPPALVAIDLEHGALLSARTLPARPLDIAVSADGARVYLALGQAAAVEVLDSADLSTALTTLTFAKGPYNFQLAPLPGGGLVVLDFVAAEVHAWSAGIDAPGADPVATKLGTAATGFNVQDLVVLRDGSGWVVASDEPVLIRAAAASTPVALPDLAGKASRLATLAVGGLAVLDFATRAVTLFDLDLAAATTTALGKPVVLPEFPVRLTASPSGTWLVAEIKRDGPGGLVTLDAAELAAGTAAPGPLVAIGNDPTTIGFADAGAKLFVGYTGGEGKQEQGGVAILDVLEEDCAAALDCVDCPDCGGNECIVLTTVHDHELDDDFEAADLDPADRVVLPSVSALAAAVRCLLARPASAGTGPAGPPGPAGPAGPQGIQGPQGESSAQAAPPKLPSITALSWPHRGELNMDTEAGELLASRGLLVGFSEPMKPATFDEVSVALYMQLEAELPTGDRGYQWVGVPCDVTGVGLETTCGDDLGTWIADPTPAANNVTGVQITPRMKSSVAGTYLVVLRGDAILAYADGPRADGTTDVRALDGNHLAPGISTRCPTGDRIEGGTFESWFELVQEVKKP